MAARKRSEESETNYVSAPHLPGWLPVNNNGKHVAYYSLNPLTVKSARVSPGELPDGTLVGMFLLETANFGNLEWMLTPRQAYRVAMELVDYAQS